MDTIKMTATNFSLENFIGRDLIEVTKCNAPDISDINQKWLPTFCLNSTFKVHFKEPIHQMILSYLRKTETSFLEYTLAREALNKYVSTDNNMITPYFHALSHFEICISYAWQALEIIMDLSGEKLFTPNDGSDAEKHSNIHNICKHLNKELRRNDFPIEHTGPVWLSNDGLESKDVSFSFEKMKELMESLANYAELLSSKIPNQIN
ncbi:hypothetical protein ACLHDG_07830 [Sulfurovum sp. CS9]|uniref:hypothetical protein n=1 Tax=Sulfurovum sp. CS9 TaxID=3391146 RepID=UPI0039E76180